MNLASSDWAPLGQQSSAQKLPSHPCWNARVDACARDPHHPGPSSDESVCDDDRHRRGVGTRDLDRFGARETVTNGAGDGD